MIWFDLDNSPHVPLFRPIIKLLEKQGISRKVTARDFAQTKELLEFWNIDHLLIGEHAGSNKLRKVVNLWHRSSQLKDLMRNDDIGLAVSHGSRSQVLAAKRMGIRSLVMLDYEYTEHTIFNALATYILMPSFIPDSRLRAAGFNMKKVIRYHGFKEELYLNSFEPQDGFRKELGVNNSQILVTLRPPGMVGNYHDSRSEAIFMHALNHFSADPNVVCLIVNRTSKEKNFVLSHFDSDKHNIRFLEKSVDGLQLLFHSDVAISGGGTMNREAALLGTETYSIFTGRRPYLDEYLANQGKLTFISSTDELAKIRIYRRPKPVWSHRPTSDLVSTVTAIINEKAITP